jgi:hypothetical protein
MSVGIVDPFLQRDIMPGQRFWMFLHPNTITSLRHNWSHPAFNDDMRNKRDATLSEAWLRNALSTNGPDYDEFIAAVKNGGSWGSGYNHVTIDGQYIHVGGTDAHGEVPDGFWGHVEAVIGRPVPFRASTFSCSC